MRACERECECEFECVRFLQADLCRLSNVFQVDCAPEMKFRATHTSKFWAHMCPAACIPVTVWLRLERKTVPILLCGLCKKRGKKCADGGKT